MKNHNSYIKKVQYTIVLFISVLYHPQAGHINDKKYFSS